ncbi:MAG: hypothetical protein QOH76_1715 [Thermoleophilaceae bacterium]|nr:hypothetical protein [Thermoleophilaceae bacterium]
MRNNRVRAPAVSVQGVANVFEPDFDAEQDEAPYTWRRARLGRQAGAEELGASLFEVPPGSSSFPLHVHHANEEMIVVLAGRPTLRSIDGERALEPGELVACPAGRRGAHRIDNRTDGPVRFLVVSTMNAPEVNEYPDSGKIWVRDYAPGAPPPDSSELDAVVPDQPEIDYLDGER